MWQHFYNFASDHQLKRCFAQCSKNPCKCFRAFKIASKISKLLYFNSLQAAQLFKKRVVSKLTGLITAVAFEVIHSTYYASSCLNVHKIIEVNA